MRGKIVVQRCNAHLARLQGLFIGMALLLDVPAPPRQPVVDPVVGIDTLVVIVLPVSFAVYGELIAAAINEKLEIHPFESAQ